MCDDIWFFNRLNKVLNTKQNWTIDNVAGIKQIVEDEWEKHSLWCSPQFAHNMKVISNCGFIGESLWLIIHVIQGDGGYDYK